MNERSKRTVQSARVPDENQQNTVQNKATPDDPTIPRQAVRPSSKASKKKGSSSKAKQSRKRGSSSTAKRTMVSSSKKANPKQRRKQASIKQINRSLAKLPIPTFGTWTPLVATSGIVGFTLLLAISAGVLISAIRRGDALNPFADENQYVLAEPIATPNPEFEVETLPMWQGTDRVTVLLLGADTRAGEQINQPRTDTLMLLQLNPETGQASILSIPRDLYVEVPNYGLQRINTAYVLGGGPLAVQTVEYNLGVRIDYYALVRFQVVIDLIDEIGGVTVDVPYTINDPTFPDLAYGYDPLYIEAGTHTFNGYDALRYARTRHGDSDYERARRQQQVLLAAKDKVTSLDMLPTLVSRAPALYESASENITTNMSLEQMIQLATSAAEIDQENIRNCVIDQRYIQGYRTPAGAAVSIPDRERIGSLIAYAFWFSDEGAC